MFGSKRKAFRRQALTIMADWVPIDDHDLQAFGSLLKFQFDELYDRGAQPLDAALAIGGIYFLEVVRCARNNDIAYMKHMQKYSAWLGACADHVLSLGDYFTAENEKLVKSALREADAIYLPSDQTETLGEMIREEKRRALFIRNSAQSAVEAFMREFTK